jgi:hypothetical protein
MLQNNEINIVYETVDHKFPIRIYPVQWSGVERYDVAINGVRELDIIRSGGELEYRTIMNFSFFYSDDMLALFDMINEQLANENNWQHLIF